MGGAAAIATAPLLIDEASSSPNTVVAIERGEPFDDGTYFDDGFGWVD